MNEKELFKKLFECQKSNIGRYLSMHKRAFDEWALNVLNQKGYVGFKMSYFPIIMKIQLEGSTNKEIAAAARVTKQAMSKVIKELEKMKLIRFDYHPEDGRSMMIFLTKKGQEMVLESRKMLMKLEAKYEKSVGKQKYATYKQVMQQLIAVHWEDF